MQQEQSIGEEKPISTADMSFPVSGLLCKSTEGALYLAIKSCGIGPGDYLIVPNLGSNDLAGALGRTGAVPILIDVDPEHWLIDLDLLEAFLMGHTLLNDHDQLAMRHNGAIIKGILVVHLNGNPADLDRLGFIAQRFYLPLIEDGTASSRTLFRSKPVGAWGDVGAIALDIHPAGYPSATGLLLARDKSRLDTAMQYAEAAEPYERPRLTDLDLATLQHSGQDKEKTREHILEESLCNIPQIRFQNTLRFAHRHSGTFMLETETAPELHAFLERHHIVTTSLAPPLNLLPPFRKSLYISQKDSAARLFDQVVCIPGVDMMPEETFGKIVPLIEQFFKA
jgi:dTDP-4-amino-4,6-dideoxygalactose transaminase